LLTGPLTYATEKRKTSLLLNILPKEIASILKHESRTIADHYEEASVLFADMVGFTPLSAELAPVEIVELLNEIFSFFDSLVRLRWLGGRRQRRQPHGVTGAKWDNPDNAHHLGAGQR
jgi:class 3 adenylate cyclase